MRHLRVRISRTQDTPHRELYMLVAMTTYCVYTFDIASIHSNSCLQTKLYVKYVIAQAHEDTSNIQLIRRVQKQSFAGNRLRLTLDYIYNVKNVYIAVNMEIFKYNFDL